jgi:hypothetical protein
LPRGPVDALYALATMNTWWKYAAIPSVALLWLASCGADNGLSSPREGGTPTPRTDAGFAADAGMSVPPPPPPEREERRTFETPQAGGRFVYVANPRRDTVAVIDSRTLAIQTVEAGDAPTYLVTLPGRDTALVINVNSNNLSILRSTEMGTRTASVPIVPGSNAIAVSPDGRHAIVYFDSDTTTASTNLGSLQEIAVLTLDEGMERSVRLSVGFRPRDVLFSRDASSAFVVTEDGISILRFAEITGPAIVPTVPIQDNVVIPNADAGVTEDVAPPTDVAPITDVITADVSPDAARDASADAIQDVTVDTGPVDSSVAPTRDSVVADVSITPDGRYALARFERTSYVRLVDLATRTATSLDLGALVTDLDVSPSGDFAIAVLRDRSRVVRVPLPGGFQNPMSLQRTDVTGELIGSVTISPDGRRALLYTTAFAVERVTVMNLTANDPLNVIRLRKSVRAVTFAPDGRTALVVHDHTSGNPDEANIDLETRIDRSFGYTLIEPSAQFARLQLTPADVGPLAIVPDGTHAFVLLRDDARQIAQAHRVSLQSFAVETITLGSPPSSVGAVPSTQRAFIGQDHPEGRITFIDWTTGALQSVTGFELNSRIVD